MAVDNEVPAKDMPEYMIILSDMQFDQADRRGYSALEMIKKTYKNYGYVVPKIIFWNLNSYDNTPVKFDKEGTAMISGYSPSLLKSVLSAELESFSPMNVMLDAIMNERYDY